jgi:hypothetical protein
MKKTAAVLLLIAFTACKKNDSDPVPAEVIVNEDPACFS